ncbi:MAG: glycosyltransferase [Acidobacteriota bacterium]|nr:glycosyltransferase [Acidobacteriota bacterium]
MLTDLVWAHAARAAAQRALAHERPRAVIYCSSTAALLWPRPGAIRFDTLASANRPGRHGLWQRPVERRRLREAPMLLPMSAGGLAEHGPIGRRSAADAGEAALPATGDPSGAGAVVVPMPVEPSGPIDGRRDVAALTYAANPAKKATDRVLRAWQAARREDEELVVAGCRPSDLARAGIDAASLGGVRVAGRLAPAEYRSLLRRARVFLCAPLREDYGIAQLEALADGCVLVSAPAAGPYVALPIARSLDARFVSDDLPRALRAALDDAPPAYAERAREALAPFSRAAVDRQVAERLLPRLLAAG